MRLKLALAGSGLSVFVMLTSRPPAFCEAIAAQMSGRIRMRKTEMSKAKCKLRIINLSFNLLLTSQGR